MCLLVYKYKQQDRFSDSYLLLLKHLCTPMLQYPGYLPKCDLEANGVKVAQALQLIDENFCPFIHKEGDLCGPNHDH